MALRLYTGTVTPGGTDGTLVSSGDSCAPIVFSGMFPVGSNIVWKDVKCAIRADAGETYKNVTIALKQNANNARMNIMGGINQSDVYNPLSTPLNIGTVTDVNKTFWVRAFAKGTDSGSPDISADIIFYTE